MNTEELKKLAEFMQSLQQLIHQTGIVPIPREDYFQVEFNQNNIEVTFEPALTGVVIRKETPDPEEAPFVVDEDEDKEQPVKAKKNGVGVTKAVLKLLSIGAATLDELAKYIVDNKLSPAPIERVRYNLHTVIWGIKQKYKIYQEGKYYSLKPIPKAQVELKLKKPRTTPSTVLRTVLDYLYNNPTPITVEALKTQTGLKYHHLCTALTKACTAQLVDRARDPATTRIRYLYNPTQNLKTGWQLDFTTCTTIRAAVRRYKQVHPECSATPMAAVISLKFKPVMRDTIARTIRDLDTPEEEELAQLNAS